MIQYARPTVDNLVNNLPDVLKSSRQFLAWNLEAGGKKVPLKEDGSSWGNYQDANCWRTFENAIDLLGRRRAFGIGLVLPSPQQIKTLPEFNLVPGLIAFDGDAKRSSQATPYHVPTHISDYVRSVQSYAEFSTSLKGLRALTFGDLRTHKQHLTFGDGTELSLYRRGWVTLSGLPYGDSSPTIAHRQEVLDHFIKELWPDLTTGAAAPASERPGPSVRLASIEESFVLDWGRSANENLVQQFIQGWNRIPKQRGDIIATWEMRRGWNHGDTPDNSLYTKRIVDEALWLRRKFGWTLQDVVDIAITFCKRNHLSWSFGRAKKQIADGLRYISIQTCQRGVRW
jgi:hypothetical protein